MSLNSTRARKLLKNFDFRSLFVDELGWDKHQASLEVTLDERTGTLAALAHKRGMVAFHCPTPAGQPMPEYSLRRKIEHQVAKSALEHFIIFTDEAKTTQIWQWVRREPGKPTACREHTYHTSQPGDALLQKLETIAFTLDEEDKITLPEVTGRARAAFDVERVTRRFYERFKQEHTAFLNFVKGIAETADREWYASVMLNRLMFVYFIQRKGFLDGDKDYLRNRLSRISQERGRDKFYSFYRYFLLRLFHEGLGRRKRGADLEALLGRIPYLNGGLFDIHELEQPDRYGKSIEIPDAAFDRVFSYFDQYQWHLDERPLRADNEINPDVLGYIFEKYVNQKQMGAYYTKEDITGYIGKNTVIPFLFDAARAKCRIAFDNLNGPTVWDLLQNNPDRYIQPAVRHGITWRYDPAHPQQGNPLETQFNLPDQIAAGINPPTLHRPVGDDPVLTMELRKGWNRLAPADLALPTETWREVVLRRKRYDEARVKLATGEVRSIDDLITLNLDIQQFAQDVVENCEGPELLRAFWHAIGRITVLDPTCGSGAFLFAALNILEPLYDACLERMERFVEDLERSDEKHRPEKYADFRKILTSVAAHPNRRYFILKSIILSNLFGVDIMEEAVEICKLRLFLKLAAQVEPDATAQNIGIEPLPDIDFNIRVGNTLVGYVNYDEVKAAIKSKLDLDNALDKIAVKAADLQQTFDAFRQRQIENDGSVPTEHKQELRRRLSALEDELNRQLAAEYGIKFTDKIANTKWLKSHQPFHWFIEFYGIMNAGGFDVIVGNPPYVEYTQVSNQYQIRTSRLADLGNLHAMTTLRSTALLSRDGGMSMVVPISLPSTDRFAELRASLQDRRNIWVSHFDFRPSKLFEGSEQRLTIFILRNAGQPRIFSTRYVRWYAEQRPSLMSCLGYTSWDGTTHLRNVWPKIAEEISQSILRKTSEKDLQIGSLVKRRGGERLYYKNTGILYYTMFTREPPACFINGKAQASSRETVLPLEDRLTWKALHCLLNSTLFYLLYLLHSNCRDLNPSDIHCVRLPKSLIQDRLLARASERVHTSQQTNSEFRIRNQKLTGEVRLQTFYPSANKPVFDEIDKDLARLYAFTEEELDFIINYDIKYRLGGGLEAEDE